MPIEKLGVGMMHESEGVKKRPLSLSLWSQFPDVKRRLILPRQTRDKQNDVRSQAYETDEQDIVQ